MFPTDWIKLLWTCTAPVFSSYQPYISLLQELFILPQRQLIWFLLVKSHDNFDLFIYPFNYFYQKDFFSGGGNDGSNMEELILTESLGPQGDFRDYVLVSGWRVVIMGLLGSIKTDGCRGVCTSRC